MRTIASRLRSERVARRTPRSALYQFSKGDGQVVAQSNAINRCVAKLADLYPSDPWQAALCDEVMGIDHFFLSEDQKKARRKN